MPRAVAGRSATPVCSLMKSCLRATNDCLGFNSESATLFSIRYQFTQKKVSGRKPSHVFHPLVLMLMSVSQPLGDESALLVVERESGIFCAEVRPFHDA